MDKQEDLVIKEGQTNITDEQGNVLLRVSITSNMMIVRGVDGTVIQRSWRDMLKFWTPALEPPLLQRQAPASTTHTGSIVITGEPPLQRQAPASSPEGSEEQPEKRIPRDYGGYGSNQAWYKQMVARMPEGKEGESMSRNFYLQLTPEDDQASASEHQVLASDQAEGKAREEGG